MAQVQMAATQLHSATFNEMHEQSQFALISNEGNTAEIEETKDENSDRYIVKDRNYSAFGIGDMGTPMNI